MRSSVPPSISARWLRAALGRAGTRGRKISPPRGPREPPLTWYRSCCALRYRLWLSGRYLDARALHVQEKHREPLMLRHIGIGAAEKDAIIRIHNPNNARPRSLPHL